MTRINIAHTVHGENSAYVPQVKVCGLTHVQEAVHCMSLGVNAIGYVFYPKSPRNISPGRAGDISRELPDTAFTVGVFVDEPFEMIMQTAEKAQLTGVQLHGRESPRLVERLRKENLTVIKALFMGREPHLTDAPDYAASAFLVEYGRGRLPGGNAQTWDFTAARVFGETHPLILAGGISADNVQAAVRPSDKGE